MGCFRLPIFMLSQTEREYQLPQVNPQARRQVHQGLHPQIRTSRPTNRCIQYAVLQNFRRSFGQSTPFFQSLSLVPTITMEELYRRADKFSTLDDNIRAVCYDNFPKQKASPQGLIRFEKRSRQKSEAPDGAL